ncbi:MAG TPA: hypothetical protein VGG12_09525 [Methylovirgula sp.]
MSAAHDVRTICVAAMASLAVVPTAFAQNEPPKPRTATVIPMPPMRPATLLPPAPAPSPMPQPVPAQPPVPQGKDPMVYNFAPDMPQELPPASRAQMHKCGVEWEKMKASGAAVDKTWRSFAVGCLAQQTNP